jgi:hypothetical protein
MSYVRWGQRERDGLSGFSGGSAVYVYATLDGRIECCMCSTVASEKELLSHLLEHRARGDIVPQWLLDDLSSGTATR